MSERAAIRRLGAAGLVGGGALVLHELRYLMVYGPDASRVLEVTGHHYLALVTPVVAGLMALAAWPVVAVARGRPPDGAAVEGRPFAHVWTGASGCLLAVYLLQEWLEGLFVESHSAGLTAALSEGGWSAVLLAVAIGALVALSLKGAAAAATALCGAEARPSLQSRSRAVLVTAREGPFFDRARSPRSARGPPAVRG